LVKAAKLYLIDNLDPIESLNINCYKSVNLHNLYQFDKYDHLNRSNRSKVEMNELNEITSFRNFIVIFGSDIGNMGIIFLNDVDLVLKYIYKDIILNNPSLQYRIVEDIGAFVILYDNNLYEIKIKSHNLSVNKLAISQQFNNKTINCFILDTYKLLIGFEDLTIKVFSQKDKKLWYTLLGGSMTVIPKSFVKHPEINGISNILVTRSKIIGVIGNLIREYSFSYSSINK
jgi:hypothetical protein